MSFHQLCLRRVKRADAVSGRDLFSEATQTCPGAPEWDVQWPNALAYTVDVLETSYDAIVCDEGQDFREEYWFALELLLANSKTSPLYINVLASSSATVQAQKPHARIVELISTHGVSPGDIAVLVADNWNKLHYYEELLHLPLPKPAKWLREETRAENTVLLDTVKRFKGLESPVIFLWGLDRLALEREAEVLYVGMSRAKWLLHLVAPRAVCERVPANQ